MRSSVPTCLLSALLLLAAACASNPAARSEPAANPATWQGDTTLYQLLNQYPLAAARQDSITAYLDEQGSRANELLAEAAEDANAPSTVRANALLTLSKRGALTHLSVFRFALSDRDARVRATAVAALREFLAVREQDALRIARLALNDSSPAVQAQALQLFGDSDVELLRNYLKRAPSEELRAVARDMIYVAEERGAPLTRDSATGVLRRQTSHGYALTFTPRTQWPIAQAAVGDVTIERGGRSVAQLNNIEAVAGVVPAFFSLDGNQLVYERARQIVVRDMTSGTERVIGSGIAPRPRPFTSDFTYLREAAGGRTPQRHQTRISYEVLSAPFASPADAQPKLLGTTAVTTSFDQHGNYSPARWLRVSEKHGKFYLGAPGMEQFNLPDPFGGTAQGG